MNTSVRIITTISLLFPFLSACDDDNEWPTARIDNPGQDTTIIWPYGKVDFQGTATDVDGIVVTHDWSYDFGHGAGVSTGYVVFFLTLAAVDAATDVVSGEARRGTDVEVLMYDPLLPFPEGHAVHVIADATGTWTADFTGVFDILPDRRGR